MGLSWALDAKGCVRDRSTEEGMQELVSEWAPELEDVAADLHQRLATGLGQEGGQPPRPAMEDVVQRADAGQLGHCTRESWHREAEGKRHAAAGGGSIAIAGTLTGVWGAPQGKGTRNQCRDNQGEARH